MSIPRAQWTLVLAAVAVAILILGRLVGILLGSLGIDIHLRR